MLRASLLVLTLLFAGCVGSAPEPVHNHMPMHGGAHEHVYNLHSNMTLSASAAEPGVMPIGWSYQDWIQGKAPPTWKSAPAMHAMLVSEVNVTITYRAAAPVISSQLRPQFTTWFGAVDDSGIPAIVDHMFAPGPDVVMPGESHTALFSARLPAGGLVLPTGNSFVLQVATYYPDATPTTWQVDLAKSSVTWTGGHVAEPPVAATPDSEFTGRLNGGRCVADANPMEIAMARHSIEVTPETVALTINLQRTGGAGAGADMDMNLVDANGTRVAYAGGSAVPEAIRLYQSNFENAVPGTWTLTIYNCQPQTSTYTASVTTAFTVTAQQ